MPATATLTAPPPKIIRKIPAKVDTSVSPVQRILRVAAYARVSTDKDEQTMSYNAQNDFYTDKIMRNPEWMFVGIYTEANIFLRTIFSLARLIGQTAHKAPVYADFLNPVPA
jgi:hypothetical protein